MRLLKVIAASRYLWLLLAATSTTAMLSSLPVSATTSLKLAPLEYKTTLGRGEKKKGFVDVSNPSNQSVKIKASTQAFEQTDDDGALRFFDSEALSSGIILDLDEFELGPHDAVRMYFLLDSTKLPQGDIFGAIFLSAQDKPQNTSSNIGQQVKLGTILSIVNGTPGSRDAELVNLSTSFVQMSDTIEGKYSIKNTGDPSKTTGFYPLVQLQVSPFGESKQQEGRLVFAGRTRENEFKLKAPYIGLYKVSVSYGSSSSQSRWVLVAHPLAVVLLAGALFIGFAVYRLYKRRLRSISFSVKR